MIKVLLLACGEVATMETELKIQDQLINVTILQYFLLQELQQEHAQEMEFYLIFLILINLQE